MDIIFVTEYSKAAVMAESHRLYTGLKVVFIGNNELFAGPV